MSSSANPSMSEVMLRIVAFMRLKAMTPGIATKRPTTVVTSAAEMDGAIVARLALPAEPISANASRTPQTVPRRPSIGSSATSVATMDMPCSTRISSSSSACSHVPRTSSISRAVSAAAPLPSVWRPTSIERTSGASILSSRSHVSL